MVISMFGPWPTFWCATPRGITVISPSFMVTGPVTINEGEMTVIPRGVAHQNVGHGPNIEITIYARKPLKRLCPTDAEAARMRMKIKDGKPVVPPVTLDDGDK